MATVLVVTGPGDARHDTEQTRMGWQGWVFVSYPDVDECGECCCVVLMYCSKHAMFKVGC